MARTSRRGRQFFAHHREWDCALPRSSESEAHRALKAVIAARIDATPRWEAVVEYTQDRSWITKVMAIFRCRQCIALEVQLSFQTEEVYEERTQRYFDAGIRPVWVVPCSLSLMDLQVSQIKVAVFEFPRCRRSGQLLAHETYQYLMRDVVDAGQAIDRVLAVRFTWRHGNQRQQWPEVLDRRQRRVGHDRRQREFKAQQAEAEKKAAQEAIEDFRVRVADAEQRRGRRHA